MVDNLFFTYDTCFLLPTPSLPQYTKIPRTKITIVSLSLPFSPSLFPPRWTSPCPPSSCSDSYLPFFPSVFFLSGGYKITCSGNLLFSIFFFPLFHQFENKFFPALSSLHIYLFSFLSYMLCTACCPFCHGSTSHGPLSVSSGSPVFLATSDQHLFSLTLTMRSCYVFSTL